jgi:hypothetical protein
VALLITCGIKYFPREEYEFDVGEPDRPRAGRSKSQTLESNPDPLLAPRIVSTLQWR